MTPRSIFPQAAPVTLAALALAAVVACCACSSNTPPGAACNPCSTGTPLPTIPGHDANPDGVSYPSPAGGYGHTARVGHAPSKVTPGSIIANLKFRGYPNGDTSKGLQIIALADYYDPCGKRLKVLHLTAAALWCVPCNQETDAFVAAKAQFQSAGVVVLQALVDGSNMGVGATQQDLDYWLTRHLVNFSAMLDPGPTEFGGFFNAAAIPWNADVDPRTMELLDSATAWAGDAMSEVQPGLNAVNSAPLYPIAPAAACTDQ